MFALPPLHPIHRPIHPLFSIPTIEERIAFILTKWQQAGSPSALYWEHNSAELMCLSIAEDKLFLPGDEIYAGIETASPREGSTIQAKQGFMVNPYPFKAKPVLYLAPTDDPSYYKEGQTELESRSKQPSPLYREGSPLIEPPPRWSVHTGMHPLLIYKDKGQKDAFSYGCDICRESPSPEEESPQFFRIISDMAKAVQFIHARGQVHTDLSLENFLIVNRKEGGKGAQIIDIYHLEPITPDLIQKDLTTLGITLLKFYRLHPYSFPRLEALLSQLIPVDKEQISHSRLVYFEEEDWKGLFENVSKKSSITLDQFVNELDNLSISS
ncbi:MAG: hypothetical protein KBC64_04645 [Simkaniaceae bacterium]|nr:hypothetical protein [Simkaniaceae bacterium]